MGFHIILLPLPEVIISKGLETSVTPNLFGYILHVHTGWKIPQEAINLRTYGFGAFDFDTFNDPRVSGWVLYISPFTPILRVIALLFIPKKEKAP